METESTHTELYDEVREWLGTKGSSLWANWLTTSEDELELAAEWFTKELKSFWRHRMVVAGFKVDSKAYDVV